MDRLENLNFWTLTKNIDDIKVDKETKKIIEELRTQARVLSLEGKAISSNICIKDNAVVVTKEDVIAFNKNWDEMTAIRNQIEVLIKKKEKRKK
jgi:hypothetical protein